METGQLPFLLRGRRSGCPPLWLCQTTDAFSYSQSEPSLPPIPSSAGLDAGPSEERAHAEWIERTEDPGSGGETIAGLSKQLHHTNRLTDCQGRRHASDRVAAPSDPINHSAATKPPLQSSHSPIWCHVPSHNPPTVNPSAPPGQSLSSCPANIVSRPSVRNWGYCQSSFPFSRIPYD